jgi:hypothetical protein
MGYEMNHQPESEFAEFCGLWTEEEAKSFLAAIEDLERIDEDIGSPPKGLVSA